MIVMKFGGSSIADAGLIKNVAGIVKSQVRKGPIVVVSAVGKTTNALIDVANSAAKGSGYHKCNAIVEKHLGIIRELGLERRIIDKEISQLRNSVEIIRKRRKLSSKNLDLMMSFGERMSARIVSACLRSIGVGSEAHDAFDLGLVTDSGFGNANPLPKGNSIMRSSLKSISYVPVVTGFIGKDTHGNVTTLGRGGSDYTASLVGTAIGAGEIQIWTNTNGIMTADPRITPKAKNIAELSYEEELELEHLGANTLHPRGVRPAFEKEIEVRVLNTLRPQQKGTLIKKDIGNRRRVASITHKDNMQIVRISFRGSHKTPHEVLGVMKRHGISVDSVAASRTGMSILMSGYYSRNIRGAVAELGRLGKVSAVQGLAKVSVVGKSLSTIPGISGRVFSSLKDIQVDAISYGSSGMSQSFFVKEDHAKSAIRKLHKEFFGA